MLVKRCAQLRFDAFTRRRVGQAANDVEDIELAGDVAHLLGAAYREVERLQRVLPPIGR